MRHLKKIVIGLMVMLIALTTVLTLTACSISTGFASQEELAKAHLEMMTRNSLTRNLDGNALSFNDIMKFYNLSETTKLEIEILRQEYEIQISKLKADIALKKAGNYELGTKDEDGLFRKLSKEDYEKQLDDAKKTADSYVFIEAKKDADLTKNAQKPNKTIEVWVIKYEYYKYIDGIKDNEKSEEDYSISLININGKWFLNQSVGGGFLVY